MAQQAIDDDEARVGGDDVGSLVLRDERARRLAIGTRRWSTTSPSRHAGTKSAGSHRSWTKIVSRCRPSGCSRQRWTVPFAPRARGERRFDAGFLARFLDHGGGHRLSRRDAAADEIVEQAGIDRLRRAAPRDPHLDVVAAADESVDVRRVGVHAEVARGGALELEPRRRAEFRRDVVALVAPGGELVRRRRACVRPGRAPRFAPARRRSRRRSRCARRARRRCRQTPRAAPLARRRPSRRRRLRRTAADTGVAAARARARARACNAVSTSAGTHARHCIG